MKEILNKQSLSEEQLKPKGEKVVEDQTLHTKRLITAALPYINNVPHLGHIVGSHMPADIFARFSRMKGFDTLFVGGSDENGTPSEIAAESLGITTKELCDVLHEEHRKIYEWFNISYDNYSRTSNKNHHEFTVKMFEKIQENGFISKETIEMFYDAEAERFLPDRYVEGTCPKCGFEGANGDQCESCTAVLSTEELVNPKSKLTNSTPEIRKTEHLFLGLGDLSDSLKEWIETNDHWQPHVQNSALGWIKEGLRKRGITRDLKNGIKVPVEGMENKVFYVWFDAPIAYISASIEAKPDEWEDYWKNKDSNIYHFLGKDNIPFHTIFWPAILMAHGEYNLPHQVTGMQYLNYEGGKFSKSKKRGIFCENLPDSGIDPDILRAYLTLILPDSSRDTEFDWNDFQTKINSELIANLGNFVNRTLSFSHNKIDEIEKPDLKNLDPTDEKFLELVNEKIAKVENLIEKVKLKQAFAEILSLSSIGNKFFHDAEPWNLVKQNESKTKQKLYLCVHLTKVLAKLISPFLPDTSLKIWEQLGLEGAPNEGGSWDEISSLDIPSPHKIDQPTILYKKMTDAIVDDFKSKIMKVNNLEDYFD